MCVLSIKVPIRKKSGNLLNTPCIYIVTVHKIFIPGREFILRTCDVGAVWHLIPCNLSPS